MDDIELKDVENLEELKIKVKELKKGDSLYLIEYKDMDEKLVRSLHSFLKEHGINCALIEKLPEIKELKKL